MFDKIRTLVVNLFDFIRGKGIEEVTGVKTCASDAMLDRVELWRKMFSGCAPWNDRAHSAGVLQQILGVLDSVIARELGVEVENKAIENAMNTLDNDVARLVDYMVITGGAVFRPIYANNKLQFELLPLGDYLPIKYDYDSTLIEAAVFKNFFDNGKKFLLMERHTYKDNNHTIENTLFSTAGGSLSKVLLSDCADTRELLPLYTWVGCKMPLIVEFRNISVNNIDGSLVPVSIICGSEELIKDADEQYERMRWEQEAGEMRTFIDRSLIERRTVRNGEVVGTKIGSTLNRLMVQLEGDIDGEAKITEHAPTLRTASQNEMFQEILRRIELSCNIGKGTISDMEQVAQTATQYSGGRQQFFAIVDKLEDEIEHKYQKCATVLSYMARAYGLGPGGDKITVTWNDDQTRKDIIQAKQIALQELSAGVLNDWEYRMQFFGEDEATAKAAIPKEAVSDGLDDLRGGE